MNYKNVLKKKERNKKRKEREAIFKEVLKELREGFLSFVPFDEGYLPHKKLLRKIFKGD